jgi:hypothetical protein
VTAADLSAADWAALAHAEQGACIDVNGPTCTTPAEDGRIYCRRHGRQHQREYGSPNPTLAEYRAELERLDRTLGVAP